MGVSSKDLILQQVYETEPLLDWWGILEPQPVRGRREVIFFTTLRTSLRADCFRLCRKRRQCEMSDEERKLVCDSSFCSHSVEQEKPTSYFKR